MANIGAAEARPLSAGDIMRMLPGTRIWTEPQLAGMQLADALGRDGSCVILIPVTTPTNGHWVCLWDAGPHIEWFDPYGMGVDVGLQRYVSPAARRRLHETQPNVLDMLMRQDKPVLVSHGHFESMRPDIDTCGRHVCVRLLHRNLDDSEYARFIYGQGANADAVVTTITRRLIGH